MRHYNTMTTEEMCQMPIEQYASDNALLFMWVTLPYLYDMKTRASNDLAIRKAIKAGAKEMPKLKTPKDAMAVMDAWGFHFKTVAFNWIKTNPGKGQSNVKLYEMFEKACRENGDPDNRFLRGMNDFVSTGYKFGVGSYFKSNAEICLLGLRKGSKQTKRPALNKSDNVIIAPVREHSRKPWEAQYRIEKEYPNCRKLELFCREPKPGWDAFGNQVDKFSIGEHDGQILTAL